MRCLARTGVVMAALADRLEARRCRAPTVQCLLERRRLLVGGGVPRRTRGATQSKTSRRAA